MNQPTSMPTLPPELAPWLGERVADPGTRQRVLERVQASAQRHAEYRTIRREDGAWQPLQAGVARRVLRDDGAVLVELLRLDEGAELPLAADAVAEELLVLQGALGAGKARHAHGVRRADAAQERLFTTERSLVYRRVLRASFESLPALEAHWWTRSAAGWVDASAKPWLANGPGVQVQPLRGDRDVVSMLVRFAPGAAVPDHRHALDEDCLVLEGDMFLGDILLREGDFQLAPAGGSHFGECSDNGVLFYFHGALDPVLRG